MDEQIKVELVTGKSKADPKKEWTAIKVIIGDWDTLIFPKTRFEMNYIKTIMAE